MKTIGLIGGMSWESTAVYYRLINEAVRQRLGGLHSADILLRSLDFTRVVALQRDERWDEAGNLLAEAAGGLERAGASVALICTNTMHLVADAVARTMGIPLLHIVDVTGQALAASGRRRPLLLATRYTMEQGFYANRLQDRFGIQALVPDEEDRACVHAIIFDELCQGKILETSRSRLLAMIEKGRAMGADSVILGCTEICLILDPDRLSLPGFDSTTLHAEAAVDFALSDGAGKQAA